MPDDSKVVTRPEAKATTKKAPPAAKTTKAKAAPKAKSESTRKASVAPTEGTKIDAFDGKEYPLKNFGTKKDPETGEYTLREDVIRANRAAYAAANKIKRDKARAEADKAKAASKAAAAKKAPAPKAADA